MSSVTEFVQHTLRTHVAPPNVGSAKARIRHAARALGWSASRTKDCWYADPRVQIRATELRAVEAKTGVHYGRDELRNNDDLIARAEMLMAGNEENFRSAFLAALRALARTDNRS